MSLAIAPIAAATSNPPANSPPPAAPLGAGPGDSSGQIEAALAVGGQVESNNSFVQFRFVDGRLTIVGRVTDITLVVPTHDSTGLASSRLPVSKAPDPLQAALLSDIASSPPSTRTPLQANIFAETHPFTNLAAPSSADSDGTAIAKTRSVPHSTVSRLRQQTTAAPPTCAVFLETPSSNGCTFG